MTREERIRYYEKIFDEAESLLKQMEEDLTVLKKLKKDLKRGVLSEDGIYDLLERYREMKEEYTGLMKGEQGNG